MSENEKRIDLLGLAPFGDSVKIATQGAVDGASAFFSRICLPAAEEFGLFIQDKVHGWRTNNVAAMAGMAETLLGDSATHAAPRIVSQIVEEASWVDDPYLQSLWAGLLAASCTEGGDDDSNLMFLALLSNLTRLQCRILKYSCENAPKYVTQTGLPFSRSFMVDVPTLVAVTGCEDIERIDREMDNLRGLELIRFGFDADHTPDHQVADIAPTAIALHMYVRCNGSRESPATFFDLKPDPRNARTGSDGNEESEPSRPD